MKITGGRLKGQKIFSIKGIRPTPQLVRTAIFNIIGEDIMGANFLDLCAGSGAVGIEALSRGASSCTFVEINQKCVNIIKKNINALNLRDRAFIKKIDVLTYIKMLKDKFDIVFIDPPYAFYDTASLKFFENLYLFARKSLIIQKDKRVKKFFQTSKQKYYGDTVLEVLSKHIHH
jgi:16S rRNA (guanine(966)-N(2))-methyltransferase RsmD